MIEVVQGLAGLLAGATIAEAPKKVVYAASVQPLPETVRCHGDDSANGFRTRLRKRLYEAFAQKGAMRRKYTNIAIPQEVAQQIDKFINDAALGYSSRAQFVLDALRQQFLQLRRGR